MNPEFNADEALERFSRKLVLHKFNPAEMATGGYNYFLEVKHLLKDLPDRVNSTITKIEKLNVNLQHFH